MNSSDTLLRPRSPASASITRSVRVTNAPHRHTLSMALVNAIAFTVTPGHAVVAALGMATLAAPGLAMADGCQLYNSNGNISCYLNTGGTPGTPAAGSGSDPVFDDKNGSNGGPGGPAGSINLDVEYNPHLFDYAPAASSPVNAVSVGGAGAQGSDATDNGFDKTGGTGGQGGRGGDVTVTVGTSVLGTAEDTSIGISGLTIISLGGEGGAAAKGNNSGTDGDAAPGGDGGTINATLDGHFTANFRSAVVSSQGGAGGRGRDWGAGYNMQGADATYGVGGNGGNVTASFLNAGNAADNGFYGAQGVLVQSVGGAGGNGGTAADGDGNQGGSGGSGGNGQNVNVTVASNVIMEESANNDAALHVLSQGGTGGQGSNSGGSGGDAGAGGNAGDVSLNFTGSGGGQIAANGTYAPGVLAQSLGGNGGDGGVPSEFVIGPNGGSGSNGGTAGSVSVTGTGLNVRTGIYVDPQLYEGSPGVLAQSIGGGGGSGAVSKGAFAIGGDGGNGVNGNTVNVALQSTVETFGFGSDGLAAQSIGGGGGKGGDAVGTSVGLNYVVGGTGGGGGAGDTVSLTSQAGSRVLTHGAHAPGLLVQSVGGGGGQGGSAYSKTKSAGFGSSMSLGGDGKGGGDACGSGCDGTTAQNEGRITTEGSDSFGILAQSIGGGGGAGGASTAKAQVLAAEDTSIALAVAIGGSGGQAGDGGTLTAGNSGLITTTGEGAVGMLTQSIGGGGGAGGDASSAATATGGEFDISASLSFGGSGGTGGAGGNASANNTGGVILTTGESAAGMLVQSVGGGGGAGGGGDGQANASGGSYKLSATLNMGGTGKSGGDGFGASASNIGGSIITLGDGAFGIGAQSIGGGGGAGGGAAGSTKGEYSATVTMGANGGNGGNTYHIDGNGNEIDGVSVLNDAKSTIVTFGADANGIVAQSIGGGGGIGGKAGSNIGTQKSDKAGGNGGSNAGTAISALNTAYDAGGSAALNNYLGLNNAVNFTGSLLANSTSQVAAAGAMLGDDDIDNELDDQAQSKGETDDDNESTSIQLSVALGASGGSGGSAGLVSVTNAGEIATMGNHSDAILAQAIGGGGGKGGAASTASTDDYSGNLSVGGSGGGGGYGGQVVVDNSGAIYTKGALAAGIIGESIAGGGGVGGVSASSVKSSSKNSGDDDANDGAFKSLSLSVGGNGGSSFDAGQVNITSSGAISTAAHDASGVIAQSITGGGGIAKTLASDLEGAGGSASTHGGDYDVQFKFGGSAGESSGGSGLVNVTTQAGGTITTKGDNSYGILAQSIAGGGGVQLGGTVSGSTVQDFFGAGKTTGSVNNDGVNSPTSGNSGLFVNVGDAIQTYGENAIGVIAQSIGGGGGIAGGIAGQSTFDSAPVYFSGSKSASGNGGYIHATVAAGASVGTVGGYSPAMLLQSIGGGGGRVITDSNIYMGTAGGSGTGGAIDATIDGTVWATNTGSAGIIAQSMGDASSNSPINITIGSTGKVLVGEQTIDTSPNGASAGIYIDHGGTGKNDSQGNPVVNTITNNGTLYTYGSKYNSVAVYSVAGDTQVINNGTLGGDVLLTNGGGTGCFTNNGTFNAGDKVTVGACGVTNNGVMDLRAGPLAVQGNLDSTAGGKIVLPADFSGKSGPAMTVDGDATIASKIEVRPTLMRNSTLTLATASGHMTLDPALAAGADTQLYHYQFDTDGQSLHVTPSALFGAQASGLGANQRAVANNLQSLFDGGATMDKGFTRLTGVTDGASYASALGAMSGKALGAFGAFRYNSSRDFAMNLYGGCSNAPLQAKSTDNCVWGRVLVNGTQQDETRDALGYRADTTAYQSGGQLQLSPDLALTGSLAYEDSRLRDTDGSATVDGNAVLGGVGLLYTRGNMELSGGIDAASGRYRSERDIDVAGITDIAKAKPTQWQAGAHVRAAYTFAMGDHAFLRPFVEGHAIRVDDKAFTENGDSPFRLAVEGNADTALIGVAGLEAGASFKVGDGMTLRPFASAALEMGGNRDWITTARFADQPQSDSFDLRTAGPDTLGRFSLGAELIGSKNLSLAVMYVPEVGKDYSANSGLARLTWRF